jgi:hypothetical protein
MAEWLAPLPVTQVARVLSPVLARLTISVEKLALFCNPKSGGTFLSTAIEIIKRLKFAVAKAKVFPHLEAWVRVGRGLPHVKGNNSTLRLGYFQETMRFKKIAHSLAKCGWAREKRKCAFRLIMSHSSD